MLTAETFLAEIESFLQRTEMPPTSFGKAAVGDPSFVSDLRAGRAPSLRLVKKVNEFIQEHDSTSNARESKPGAAA